VKAQADVALDPIATDVARIDGELILHID